MELLFKSVTEVSWLALSRPWDIHRWLWQQCRHAAVQGANLRSELSAAYWADRKRGRRLKNPQGALR
jgi:hypothetical protein